MRAAPEIRGESAAAAAAVGAVLREQLRSGPVWVRPRGFSMRPTIFPGDSVQLVRASPQRGSVALVVHDNRLWLHRLVRQRRGRWLLWGDARPRPDGWIDASQIVAVVRAKRRNGRDRDLSGALTRSLGCARAACYRRLRRARGALFGRFRRARRALFGRFRRALARLAVAPRRVPN